VVTDRQVRRLRKLMRTERTLAGAAAKAGMDERTARKYLEAGKLPTEMTVEHQWRTRADPFLTVWPELGTMLQINPGLEAKTLFGYLLRKYPGGFEEGQLRTLQRRVRIWRALEGPPKEVFFPQLYRPGELCESDFTVMNDLGVMIGGERFNHLVYHFVLPYSNWETGTPCFSESLESLSEGLQNALWELGGVPKAHQTDRLTAAVHKPDRPEVFTRAYKGLLDHYGLEGRKTNAASPNENGDVEQRHARLKQAVEQQLLLRGSRDFASRIEYAEFLSTLFAQLNSCRKSRLAEELAVLHRLPLRKLDAFRRLPDVTVSGASTITVVNNTYSVDSRLIGEKVVVRLYSEYLEVWFAQRCLERIPRLRGQGKHFIQYRHIIDWLLRKPGAFENYRYREDLFPTTSFRITYDGLRREHTQQVAAREYLAILSLAAKESESLVEEALGALLELGGTPHQAEVKELVSNWRHQGIPQHEVTVLPVVLSHYDRLLAGCGEEVG
jgi:hypothetical protein